MDEKTASKLLEAEYSIRGEQDEERQDHTDDTNYYLDRHRPRWLHSTRAWLWQPLRSSPPPETQRPTTRHRRHSRPIFRLQDRRERALLALLAFCIFWSWFTPWASTPSDPVEAVLKEVPLIDTHIDFPIFLRAYRRNQINNLTADETLPGQVDFPRMRKGRLGAVFWSVWVPCPKEEEDAGALSSSSSSSSFDDDLYTEAVAMTFEQIDLVHRLVGRLPDQLSLTTTSAAIFHNHQFPPPYRTVGSVVGGEGLHSIGNRASNLRLFHELGMRYMTLTHNCHNIYADAAVAPTPPVHGGLSAKGRAMVLEMNRMGMMVDLAHVSAATMRDALAVTEAPVIFSHSGARGVNDHPRNVPDDVLDLLPANGGVVQVVFLPDFVTADPRDADLAAVADHIVYIGERIGYEHVGIGSDYDGMLGSGPAGLEDVASYPDLLRELWRRGLTYKQLSGIVGKNLLRVMQQVELVAARSTRLPLEDDIPDITNGSTTFA